MSPPGYPWVSKANFYPFGPDFILIKNYFMISNVVLSIKKKLLLSKYEKICTSDLQI